MYKTLLFSHNYQGMNRYQKGFNQKVVFVYL